MKWTTILTEQLDKLKADAARADKWEAIAEKYMKLFFKASEAAAPADDEIELAVREDDYYTQPTFIETPLCGFSGCCLAAKWRITWWGGEDAFAYACTNHLGAMLGDEIFYKIFPLYPPASSCVE